MVNIGSLTTGCRVIAVKGDQAKIALNEPICTEVCFVSSFFKGFYRLMRKLLYLVVSINIGV